MYGLAVMLSISTSTTSKNIDKIKLLTFFCFSGLNASNEELNLKAHNIWAFTTNESGDTFDKYLDMDVEEAMDAKVPLMFISFPSAKGG